MLTDIHIRIDESILTSLKKSKGDFTQEMLFQHASFLYRQQKLSLGKAAELAGYDRIDFVRELQAAGQAVFDYDDELIAEMIESADEVLEHIRAKEV